MPDHERGSVLLLFPVAVLVVVVLASLAVDRAVVVDAQRDLVVTAQAAANDGAGLGVDTDALRDGRPVTYDADRIDRAVRAATATVEGLVTCTWSVHGDVLEVRLRRSVHLVFASGVPGASDTERVDARASALLIDVPS